MSTSLNRARKILDTAIELLERNIAHQEQLHAAMRQIAKESDRLQLADRLLSEALDNLKGARSVTSAIQLEAEIQQAKSEIGSVMKALVGIYQKAFRE